MTDKDCGPAPPLTSSTLRMSLPETTPECNCTEAFDFRRMSPPSTTDGPPITERVTTAAAMTAKASAVATLWTPETTITDMPNEVLREMFFCVEGNFSRTLWSLSLTCKHFRSIIEEHCEPEYNLRGKWIQDPYTLMERIRDQPYLRRIIRVLRMDYNFADYTKHTDAEVEALVTSLDIAAYGAVPCGSWGEGLWPHNGGPIWLCLLLPQVETIELSTETSDTCLHEIPLSELLHRCSREYRLHSHGFVNLQNLSLAHPPPKHGVDDLGTICITSLVLPNLRKVKLGRYTFDGEAWYNPRADFMAGACPVRELEMHGYQNTFLYLGILHWDTFSNLKVLHLHIEDTLDSFGDNYESPQYVENMVALAHSLESLQLYSNEQYCSKDGAFSELPLHYSTQRGLGCFTKLRSLALTDMSLVGVSIHGPAHWHQPVKDTLSHLADMFPPNLETFTHLLWDGPASFSKALTKRQLSLRSWERIWTSSRKNQFPSLKKVMVQKYGLDGLSKHQEVIWESKD